MGRTFIKTGTLKIRHWKIMKDAAATEWRLNTTSFNKTGLTP